MWPKEHGSWTLLVAPILAGFAASGGAHGAPTCLLLAGALGAFLARVPLLALAGPNPPPGAAGWLAAELILAAAALAPLLVRYERWGLLWLAPPAAAALALNLRLSLQRRAFSWLSELSGIAAMSLGAPAAVFAATGAFGAGSWWLWLAVTLFFSGPVFHVKAAAAGHRAASDPLLEPKARRAARVSVAFHAVSLLGAGVVAATGRLPALLLLAFALSLAKSALAARRPPARADFRRLGWTEVVSSAFFLVLAAVGYSAR